MKKLIISILSIILIFLTILSTNLYISLNKLQESYNNIIIQQLFLIENKDTNASQSLLTSYIKNELMSISNNNEFSNYKHLCSKWSYLKEIILKYTYLDKNNRHLSNIEKMIIEKKEYNFQKVNKNILKFCKDTILDVR